MYAIRSYYGIPNYDNSLNEPSVMPSKVPNLLINGSSGIAVGMATNIPPHNITEVLNALIVITSYSIHYTKLYDSCSCLS